MAEDIEYSELLDRASETEDPFQRLLFVSVLAVSHYCSAQQRIAKPFNPLLGETFELWLPEKNNLKFMSEQVSHHPPISASFATAGTEEKISWTYSAVHMVANKFWGKSIEVFFRPDLFKLLFLVSAIILHMRRQLLAFIIS
ncbi:Oxysterol-binding protein 1 [Galdieria sulphuraria]|nr:Oxysterol-binding protein 1 [Galdieria sulphuraria]